MLACCLAETGKSNIRLVHGGARFGEVNDRAALSKSHCAQRLRAIKGRTSAILEHGTTQVEGCSVIDAVGQVDGLGRDVAVRDQQGRVGNFDGGGAAEPSTIDELSAPPVEQRGPAVGIVTVEVPVNRGPGCRGAHYCDVAFRDVAVADVATEADVGCGETERGQAAGGVDDIATRIQSKTVIDRHRTSLSVQRVEILRRAVEVQIPAKKLQRLVYKDGLIATVELQGACIHSDGAGERIASSQCQYA